MAKSRRAEGAGWKRTSFSGIGNYQPAAQSRGLTTTDMNDNKLMPHDAGASIIRERDHWAKEYKTLELAGDELVKQRDALRVELDKAKADVAKLRAAIETVLRDDESAPGGWGPDVTCQTILREALAATTAP